MVHRLYVQLALLAWLCVPSLATALGIPYQGHLEQNGAPVSGTQNLRFFAVTDPAHDADQALWSEIHVGVQVQAGAFSVELGSVTPFPPELFARDALYIGVEVGGVPLAGRQRLLAVPYAVEGLPPGTVMPYAGAAAPAGWVLCHGQSLAVADHGRLFAVIGYTYGGSGGSFNVPDMRGRVPLGQDSMGGTAANRVSASQAASIGQGAGTETAQLLAHTHDLPAHQHGIKAACNDSDCGNSNDGFTRGSSNLDSASFRTLSGGNGATVSAGEQAPTNMPPYLTLTYIIKL